MVGVGLVRRLRVGVKEALVALRHDVAALAAPVLEASEALGVGALPRRGARVVVHVVHAPARVAPDLPARRQRLRPLPRCRPRVVVHVIPMHFITIVASSTSGLSYTFFIYFMNSNKLFSSPKPIVSRT